MTEALTVAGAAAGAAIGLSSMAKGLLEKALGPAADAIGAHLQHRLHSYFEKNRARIVEDAAAMVEASKRAAHEVPLRTLLPLLNGASIEDDETLQRHWSALLANAATAEDRSEIPPLYTSILAQLTPFAARVLDAVPRAKPIRAAGGLSQRGAPPVTNIFSPVDLAAAVGTVSNERLASALDELAGHGILERWVLGGSNEVVFEFTSLGDRFLKACRPPAPASTADEANQHFPGAVYR